MPDFDSFYEAFLLRGLEGFRKYYGWYRGTVTRVDDPTRRGRIQAKVLQVGHTIAPNAWIDPAFEGAGTDRGAFFPPEIGDSVRVAFEHGRPDKPILYIGGWYGEADLPTEFAYTEGKKVTGQTGTVAVPERRGIVTRKGHRLLFADVDGEEAVELSWHKPDPSDAALTADARGDRSQTADRTTGKTSTLLFNADGDVVLSNQNGSKVTLSAKNKNIVIEDENKNVVTIDKSGVVVDATKTGKIVLKGVTVEVADGADTPAVRGRELDTWLKSHTHGTAWGPSTPPLSPPPPSILSKNVKLK
jgi:hypothetical protein